jgi:hypothetical protein
MSTGGGAVAHPDTTAAVSTSKTLHFKNRICYSINIKTTKFEEPTARPTYAATRDLKHRPLPFLARHSNSIDAAGHLIAKKRLTRAARPMYRTS